MTQPSMDLEALLDKLKSLPAGTSADQVLESLRGPRSQELENARERAALVRFIDERIFQIVIEDQNPPPPLAALVEAFPQDFERIPPDRWCLREPLRQFLLEQWRTKKEPEWRDWNTKLYRFFKTQVGKTAELETVYHASASSVLKEGREDFDTFFKNADARSDFAHCHALLEVVRVQDRSRGSEFSQLFRDRSRLLQARLLFLDALQKSRFFLDREVYRNAVLGVLNRASEKPWIFHIHATGGMGKTMLLRWLIAHHSVPERIPCARIDFDDHRDGKLINLVNHPMWLISSIVGQWAQQHPALSTAALSLSQAESAVGWDPKVLSDLQSRLADSSLGGPMLIVLDTLEEATLSQLDWLKRCVAEIRRLHDSLPRMTLVLSGRYDLSDRSVFSPDEATVFEVQSFTPEEARAYLLSRKVETGAMQDAIVRRTMSYVVKDGTRVELGINPFKIALMTELVERNDIKPEAILKLPDVDVAYLMERVILRISSQPLRWVVRYGAIARRFNKPFLQEVLLPRLRDALRGQDRDLENASLNKDVRSYLDTKVTWVPEPDLAEKLDAGSLWDDLANYARDRGWISENKQQGTMQLHPEVVQPVRNLLGEQPVYRSLHADASEYYQRQLKQPIGTDALIENAGDAIYHLTQVDVEQAKALWRKLLLAGPPYAYRIASEPTLTDYLVVDENSRPLYPDWFCEAHQRSAQIMMEDAGVHFDRQHENWSAFVSHVAAASRVNPDSVPAFWLELMRIVVPERRNLDIAGDIEKILPRYERPEDAIWLRLQAASYFNLEKDHARAEPHLREASRLTGRIKVPGLSWAVDSVLAEICAAQDRYREAIDAYERVRIGSPPLFGAAVTLSQAFFALDHRDLKYTVSLKPKLEPVPPNLQSQVALLNAAIQVQTREINLPVLRTRIPPEIPLEERAAWYRLEGEVARYTLDFVSAADAVANGTDIYASAQRTDEVVAGRQRELELYAFDIGDYSAARRMLEKWALPPPMYLPDATTRVELVRAFLHLQEGKRNLAAEVFGNLAKGWKKVPARVRARIVLFGLAFDLCPFDPDALKVLDEVEPPEVFIDILDFVEYCPTQSKVENRERFDQIYRPIFNRIGFAPAESPLELPLQLMDLARILGGQSPDMVRQAFASLPSSPTPARWWYGVRLLEVCARCGIPAPITYTNLLALPVRELQGTPIEGLIKLRAAAEMPPSPKRTELAADGFKVWELQKPGRRRDDATQLLKQMNATPPSKKMNPPRPHVDVGPVAPAKSQSPVQRPDVTTLSLEGISYPNMLGTVDSAMSALIKDWRSVREDLIKMLQNAGFLAPAQGWKQIVLPLALTHLPWEFAEGQQWFRGVHGASVHKASLPGTRSVLVVKPEDDSDYDAFNVSESASSGFAVEELYGRGAAEGFVYTLKEPDPDFFRKVFEDRNPAVIHLIGQMVQSTAGVYLDFHGSQRRMKKGGPSLGLRTQMDAHRLVRIVERRRPFVILDITAPENQADAFRMMMLRNRFAAELFSSGNVRGVFATGMDLPWTRGELTDTIVEHVKRDSPMGALWQTIHDKMMDPVTEAWRRLSTALYARDPNDSIFDQTIAF